MFFMSSNLNINTGTSRRFAGFFFFFFIDDRLYRMLKKIVRYLYDMILGIETMKKEFIYRNVVRALSLKLQVIASFFLKNYMLHA